MKRYVHFLTYLTQLFLEWEMFQTNIVEKSWDLLGHAS